MKKAIAIGSVFLSLIWQDLSIAQTISGFVRENSTGEPLSYANVFIKGVYVGSTTSRDGYYVIANISPGTYEVVATIIGYKVRTEKVNIETGQDLRLDFRLDVSVIEGEEVNVSAERQKFKDMVDVSTITLDMREIEVVPAFVEADVFRSIQFLPGVQSINDFTSALYVRGSTPDQNLIMMDGVTVYNPFHLGGIFSTFNTDAIKVAEFQAGGFPARYGGRMGSILNIINREGNTEKFTGKANVSLISSKLLVEGPIPRWVKMNGSWMLAGRRTYFDKIVDGILFFVRKSKEDDPHYDPREYIGFPYRFYDIAGKLNIDVSNDHRLTISSFLGEDILNYQFTDESTYEYTPQNNGWSKSQYENKELFNWTWGNRTNSITWRWLVSPTLIVKTLFANSRFRFRINIESQDKGTIFYESDTTMWDDRFNFDVFDIVDDKTLESEVKWLLNDAHTVTTGFQHKLMKFSLGMTFGFSNLDTAVQDTALWMVERPFEQAFYVQNKFQINSRLSTKLGIRINRYSLHKNLYSEPRIGFKYLLQDDLSIKFSWGQYHQFLTTANPQDENLRFIDIWLAIPRDKQASSSDHSILGVEYLFPSDILFRIEMYYKNFDNLLTLEQENPFLSNEGEPRFETMNEFLDTDARAYGLEFLVKKTMGRTRGWLGYTYAVTKWKTEIEDWYYPKYNRTHSLNIVADWGLTRRTHMSTAISYYSGNPFSPILGRYDPWIDVESGPGLDWWRETRYVVGKKNSDRYPPYFRWDVGLVNRKQTKYGHRQWYLQILNVTNHMNTFMYIFKETYDRKKNEGKVLKKGIPMFPLLPTFGIKFEF